MAREELTEALTKGIEEKLREKVGARMEITFRRVKALEKSDSGKTPIVISRGAR